MTNTNCFKRQLIRLAGADRLDFLQGLATIDVKKHPDSPENNGDAQYGLFLTPKGRYLFDFFYLQSQGQCYLDVHASQGDDIIAFLNRYRLRCDVVITKLDLNFLLTFEPFANSTLSYKDPRSLALGIRHWFSPPQIPPVECSVNDYHAARAKNLVPELGFELIPEKTIPLEVNLDALGAISFNKGCYLGQELQSRTKHTGILRKGLALLKSEQALSQNQEVFGMDGPIGQITTPLIAPEQDGKYLNLAFLRAKGDELKNLSIEGGSIECLKFSLE